MESSFVPASYLEHLADRDLNLLTRVAGLSDRQALLSLLRGEPAVWPALLRDPHLHHILFAAGEEGALLHASPFLVFAALVARAGDDLRAAPFVQEWAGRGRRVPVFEVNSLREFAGKPAHTLFLAELLASYTHVASGTFWRRSEHGWRRQRYSDLDPIRLIDLLEVATPAEQIGIYRRLGDLALFLTGVFPDHAGTCFAQPRLQRRLRRLPGGAGPAVPSNDLSTLGLLSDVGRRAYLAAGKHAGAPALHDIAASFDDARRFLNVLTDRYLFPLREQWFPAN